jgi:uncharacterized peroxidase-related enzyme
VSTYLPGVEANLQPGAYSDMVLRARAAGTEYSKIWDLFAFQHDVTIHLGRFTHGVLREPASISPGFRELIAAYTSHLNACAFCTEAHVAAASELLGDERLVRQVLADLDQSSLEEREKALLRFVARMTRALPSIGAADVQALRDAGWDDEAIYFAITTCALFNFYNRWITATGVPVMSAEAHREQGRALAARGYTRE